MTDLDALYGTQSEALAINNLGQVVGYSYTSGSSIAHAFCTGANQPINPATDYLGMLGGTGSYADGINNLGEVVGWAETIGAADPHAFLYNDGSMEDLNSLIVPTAEWTLECASGINDSGQICGYGINPSGQTHAFLLTPIATPEPSTLALLGVGALSLLGYRMRLRRRRAARASVSLENGTTATLSFPSRLPEAMRRAAWPARF